MKKLLIPALVLALVLSVVLVFAACGNKDEPVDDGGNEALTTIAEDFVPEVIDDDAEITEPDAPAAPGKAAQYFALMAGGTYHMQSKLEAAGVESITDTYIKDGMTAIETEAMGQKTRIVTRDNKSYTIMDATKMIMVSEVPADQASAAEEAEAIHAFVPTRSGEGTAEFDGKTLPYEEYGIEGAVSQYFFDGDRLAGIRSIAKGDTSVDIVILALDDNVPDSVFEIPTDYQEMGV